jgi:RHS repeat-associated protein
VVRTLAYDNINRPLSVTYSDGTAPVSYNYVTGVDRLASITEGPATPAPANSQAFTYDNLGRVTSVTQFIDQVPYVTQYSYNLLGQLATITYPSGHVYTQSYDAVGRLASIANGANTYLSGLSYNAAGETLGLTMGNGVQGAFTYNDHLQLASLRYFKSGITPDPLNLAYDYTSATQPINNGQIQAMHYYTQPGTEDTNKSESFTYDSWFRLKAAQTINVNSSTAGTWSLAWTYDRLGNRKQQQLTGGNLPAGIGQPNFTIDETTNRISGFTYDLAGNLTNDGAFTYAYDGANRMKQAQQSASPNTVTSSTFFGPLRIKKAVGSTTTVYVYSGAKPIAEYVNGSLSKEYIYAGSALLATIAGTSTTYHHPDHLSNRAETDSTGAVVRTAGHFPYGESWYESSADPMKFTTYSRDSGTGETGSDYAMFRQFNSGQGRFTGPDLMSGDIGSPQSLNRYSYTGNDPINAVDPLGLATLCATPYITTEWSDGHKETITGQPVCIYWDPFFVGMVPVPGGSDQNKTDISRLRERLWKALVSDPDCLTFLGIGGAVDVLGLLDTIPIDFQDVGPSNVQARTTADFLPGYPRPQNPQIHINTNGYFSVTGSKAKMGGAVFSTGTPLFQAVVMFHELGHATAALPHDSNSPNQGDENSAKILEKCKTALSTFEKK